MAALRRWTGSGSRDAGPTAGAAAAAGDTGRPTAGAVRAAGGTGSGREGDGEGVRAMWWMRQTGHWARPEWGDVVENWAALGALHLASAGRLLVMACGANEVLTA